MSEHTAFELLVGELCAEFTTFAMDRRFGASLDGPGYCAEREFSDVVAVVESVAGRTGESVVLFGHSWDASCALGATVERPALGTLVVLYEPSLGLRYPPGPIDAIEAGLATCDQEGAVVEMFASIVGLTEDEIEERRAAPKA